VIDPDSDPDSDFDEICLRLRLKRRVMAPGSWLLMDLWIEARSAHQELRGVIESGTR
jgi:hypothetical protein